LANFGTTLLETVRIKTTKLEHPLDSQEADQENVIDSKLYGKLYGKLIAFTIISLWVVSLGTFLSFDITQFPAWLMAIAAFWQTFLYTGLFITAHDAMHGSVCPQNPKLNRAIGSLCTRLYGLFSYKELLQKHQLHHRYPASDRDPDFHDGIHTNPISWYFYFMMRYWSWRQCIGLSLIFNLLHFALHIPISNLLIFWVLPPLLSSIQLFYFGTFLTHREPEAGYSTPQRAKTNSLPIFWSFVTCYHFGYHHEHHEFPHLPWWRLPVVYQTRRT
jgi:beta-carotene ketolase (CrtW type)